MKKLKNLTYVLLLAALVFGVTARPAAAQEHKETFNSALEAAKAKKFDEAYRLFGQAAQQATSADDNAVAQQAKETMAKIDYLLGRQAVSQENFQAAVTRFDQGIKAFPTYVNNYVGKALALKKLDRPEEAIQAYVDLIELGKKEQDSQAVRQGETGLRDHFVFLASSELSAENPTRTQADAALAHLAALEEHVPTAAEDPDVLFYKAVASNAKGDYAQAVTLANKALELHRGSRTDAAKIYFVLGEAHMYAGDVAAAKNAFSNATYGSYKAPAEHYLETL